MAAKKQASGKATKKSKSGGRAKSTAKKSTAKKSKAKASKKAAGGRATGLDKSVEQFRDSLEHSVTLSVDRLQEVIDDAVKRGRMTRSDSEKMLSDLVKKGRRQTDSLLKELERLLRQARKGVTGRTSPAPRKQATQAARRARKKLS
jgi:polyhydroxyalkanoate synthesis regulator phasin